MRNDRSLNRYVSAGGTVVYKLPVEAFPNHFTNCYLVMTDPVTLLDAASGQEGSNVSMLDGFRRLREEFGESVQLSDVGRLILTHGHIDHFGGLNFVVEQSGAKIGIHELDASVVQHFKERLILNTKNLHLFLDRAGLSAGAVERLLTMNKWSKDLFRPAKVDFTFNEGPLEGTPFEIYHTPGHCPGQVCIRLDDFLFTADHVLSHITPNQSPEFISRYTGLGHYLESLKKVRAIPGISLGLGGHEDAIEDLPARVSETVAFHEARLEKTLGLCDRPRSIKEVSLDLFGERQDYHVLLAFLETGAHVEYLYERGKLAVANIEDVEQEYNPVLLYQRQ
ncbi:MAG: MBL fold metallo-hydrolase [Candidatus Hydrogenedentes bacterium]|nr:MBL fold metallo-hydrolase [Candidatus Hydrogenedentota bacterium]